MAAAMDGRVVVISGGTQGLGEATARLLIQRGARGVVIVGRDSSRGTALSKELTCAAARCHFIHADVTDPSAPEMVIAETDREFGVIHGLVNVAASTERGNIWNTDIALWERMQAVNVRAPFFLLQGAATIMRRENVAGSVVNIGSVSGYGGQPFIIAYCVSKGALSTLTKNAAFSLMRHNIRVNQVNPGWMDTESEDAVQRKYHGSDDTWLATAEAAQPTGRLVKPDEVARAIGFLLSDESGMITGTLIDFDQSVQGAGDAPKPSTEETPQ